MILSLSLTIIIISILTFSIVIIHVQAHPEDAEELHVICDLLTKGMVSLDSEEILHTEKEVIEVIIDEYNQIQGVESGLNSKSVRDEVDDDDDDDDGQ